MVSTTRCRTEAITVRSDQYAPAAEYVELFSLESWRVLRPALVAALMGADSANGPILDLGTGTGLGTEVLLDTVAGA